MGRLRATLARSAIDQQIQGHVSTAERALRSALSLCREARSNPEQSWQVSRVRRDLERCLGALSSVRTVTSPFAEESGSEMVPRVQPQQMPVPQPPIEEDEQEYDEVVDAPVVDPQESD